MESHGDSEAIEGEEVDSDASLPSSPAKMATGRTKAQTRQPISSMKKQLLDSRFSQFGKEKGTHEGVSLKIASSSKNDLKNPKYTPLEKQVIF